MTPQPHPLFEPTTPVTLPRARTGRGIVAAGFVIGAASIAAVIALLDGRWHGALTSAVVAALAGLYIQMLTLRARVDRLDAVTGAWRTAPPRAGAEHDSVALAAAVGHDVHHVRRLLDQQL